MIEEKKFLENKGCNKYCLAIKGSKEILELLIDVDKKEYKLLDTSFDIYEDEIKTFVDFLFNNQDKDTKEYVSDETGVYYKCNVVCDNVCYCINNVVIYLKDKTYCNEVRSQGFDKKKYILLDNYLLNLSSKTILCISGAQDSFIDSISGYDDIKVSKIDESLNLLEIKYNNKPSVFITFDSNNRMVSLKDPNIRYVPNEYLPYNIHMEKIELENAINIGLGFMFNNIYLEEFSFPSVINIEAGFCYSNLCIDLVKLNSVLKINEDFMKSNVGCRGFWFDNLIEVKDDFANANEAATIFMAPSCTKINKRCMSNNNSLKLIDMSNLNSLGEDSFGGLIDNENFNMCSRYYLGGKIYNDFKDIKNILDHKPRKYKLRIKK